MLVGWQVEQIKQKVKEAPRGIIQSFKRFFGGGK
jgi:hypothetical protein